MDEVRHSTFYDMINYNICRGVEVATDNEKDQNIPVLRKIVNYNAIVRCRETADVSFAFSIGCQRAST